MVCVRTWSLCLSTSLVVVLSCGGTTTSQAGDPATNGTSPPTLRQLAAEAGRLIGVAVDAEALAADETYREVLAREFDYVTPENAMKWEPLAPSPDTYDWDDADAIVQFAEEHEQAVKGHTLVWHQQTPRWLGGGMSADELRAALQQHITTTVARYRGRVRAWDVVNEAVDVTTDSGFTQSVFYELLGATYIEDAFHWARAADPDALLFYNEVAIERMGEKSDVTYELMRDLVDRGVPIDGIGFQSHVSTHRYPSLGDLRHNIRRFVELGLIVNVSEVDARARLMPGGERSRAYAQRIAFQQIVSACVVEPGCEAITFWGFTDKYSWINDDGPEDPLLFDRTYVAKPAYDGVVDGLGGKLPMLGANVLQNGDFEAGAAGWSSEADMTVERAPELSAPALCLVASGADRVQLTRTDLLGELEDGGPYAFAAMVRVVGADSVVDARLDIEEESNDSRVEQRELNIASRPISERAGWVELSGYFGLGFERSPTAIELTLSAASGADLCIADVRLQALSSG